MQIGSKNFELGKHTYVMGILNITPDSFSDGGQFQQKDKALRHVEEMIAEGMDILDIGGESTRPGYKLLSDEEEMERVLPIIEAVKKRFEIPISLDTYKSSVAREGIKAGIDLINDIWGLRYDDKIASVISDSNLPCCLMHNRKEANYTDFMQELAADLAGSIHLAEQAGIAEDKILLDPGVGFGKTYEQNLQVINNLDSLQILGYPLLLGTSRKSVIGLTLNLLAAERLEGTLATTVMAVMKGCAFVRVHDIKENVRAITMTEKILNAD